MLAVLFYCACLGLMMTASLAGPIFVGLLNSEYDVALRLSIYLLLGGFLFAALVLGILHRQRRMPRIGRLALVALVWLTLPLVAAIPIFDISALNFSDSMFEAVSGLTTSGSSVIQTLETWPRALIFWRSQLQWFGGYLWIISLILIVAPLGIGGLTSHTRTLIAHSDQAQVQRRMVQLAGRFAIIYVGSTALSFLAFFLTAVSASDAVLLAMAAISTGGFLPFETTLDQVLGRVGMVIFGLFLLLGATSIFWQSMLLGGEFKRLGRHRESYSIIALTIALALLVTVLIATGSANEQGAIVTALAEGFLAASSLVATSGVESRPGVFALLPLVVVLFVVFLGASAYSTSGGIKHYRLGAMFVQSWGELDKLIYPNAVRSRHFGTATRDIEVMKAIWSFFLATLLVIGLGTIIIASSGVEFEAALTATVVNFSTAGPVYESGWAAPDMPDWPDYHAFSAASKWALMAVMLLGRLEVLAIFGLFSFSFWRTDWAERRVRPGSVAK
ncbi:MAG: hypothetical protein OXR62_15135 [Ahrensia sp.]|nr:hypothetical protein [Ahrensia sp.]